MKTAKFLSLSLSLMLLAVASRKTEQATAAPASTAKRMYVTTAAGLRMRSEPNTFSSVLLTVPHNGEVVVVEESEKTETISGKTAKWLKVTYNGSTGWVFLREPVVVARL